MKIVQPDIQGFRSLKNVSWRPGDFNVIIGPNGSGKSSLLGDVYRTRTPDGYRKTTEGPALFRN